MKTLDTLKHYGKELTNLTEQENELLHLDMLITTTLLMNKDTDNENPIKNFTTQLIMMLQLERKNLTKKLLNINYDDDLKNDRKEVMEWIETTQYGYRKFVMDAERNKQIVEKTLG